MHPPPACNKVFRWIRKAGDVTICRKPKLDDDNNSIISTSIEHSHSIRRRHKFSIRHDIGEREIRRNKVGGDFSPASSISDRKGKKKHKSLPVPPRKPVNSAEEGTSKNVNGVVVDPRRFCMVDPFNLGGHRRSYTLDTTWNITAFFDSVSNDKDDESPATILIAKKENLARNSHNRFSMQPARRNNSKKRRSIAKEIREVEVRTFRWESRRTNREKTCSQLYELYEKQIDNSLLNNFTQDKPLPPVPFDNDDKSFCDNDSETIIDPELQSIIDTLSLISDHHSDIFDDSNSSIYTSTSTMRESFSELLITDEVMFNLIEDEISALSTRNSVNSFETLPVEVEMCLSCKRRSTEKISIQFQQSEEKRLENVKTTNSNDDVHPEAVYTNRSFSFENLIEPNVTFTKSVNPKEHLALQQYIANETKFYHLKIKSLKAENSDTAAEIYDILQYW
ncbi:9869_t:CDS:2 [Rhizophagus irregularis]|nr:9869_t:CDS:2 [Rhizophagus irregularis]